ncbi:hypothetical protein BSZ19_25920 [Bradyrhizobium japonicum]|uniref:Uncharacterized protein n=1 Tax=Bradyrhizobium japonicum TaxID=375 RepID=A0A1Y2JJM0_BRAJP|nr:hypothetical protein BSZ19_25920 [Bradyrhizobium japonicum]
MPAFRAIEITTEFLFVGMPLSIVHQTLKIPPLFRNGRSSMDGIDPTLDGRNGEAIPIARTGKYAWHGSCIEQADKAAGV